jgi:hypothetical protein
MKAGLILLALFLFPLAASGDDVADEVLKGNMPQYTLPTPEEQQAAKERRELLAAKEKAEKEKKDQAQRNLTKQFENRHNRHAFNKADKEALAIVPENTTFRTWHKGKDPQPKSKTPKPQPIVGKLIKIYPDSIVLEKKDKTTLELSRNDLIKADRTMIDKLAEHNAK